MGVDQHALDRLAPYRLPKERVVAAMQEHWAARIGPSTTCLVGLILTMMIGYYAPARMGFLANAAWWLWFALLVRTLWVFANWHVSWFVATDKRLLLLYGIVTHKVAMMPLMKVTDMSYTRSVMGRLLGYGTFVLESAGQDQALSRITYVRNPDETYRVICSQIFGSFDQDDGPHKGGLAAVKDDEDPDNPDGPDDGPDGPGGNGGTGLGDFDDDFGGDGFDGDFDDFDDEDDPTDLPVHRIGAYLDPVDQKSGPRWFRRHGSPTPDQADAPEKPGKPGRVPVGPDDDPTEIIEVPPERPPDKPSAEPAEDPSKDPVEQPDEPAEAPTEDPAAEPGDDIPAEDDREGADAHEPGWIVSREDAATPQRVYAPPRRPATLNAEDAYRSEEKVRR